MLQKIKNELRMVLMYNVVFYVCAAIHNNEGIDKYLIDELIDLVEAIPILLFVTVMYLVGTYVWKVLIRQFEIDYAKVKDELNKKEVEKA